VKTTSSSVSDRSSLSPPRVTESWHWLDGREPESLFTASITSSAVWLSSGSQEAADCQSFEAELSPSFFLLLFPSLEVPVDARLVDCSFSVFSTSGRIWSRNLLDPSLWASRFVW